MTRYYCNAVGSAVTAPVGTRDMGGGARRASLSAKEPVTNGLTVGVMCSMRDGGLWGDVKDSV